MEKFFKWFIAVFLILHGMVFIIAGLILKILISSEVSGNDSSSIFLLFPIMGLVILSIGLVILIMNMREVKRIRDLKISGVEIKAEITGFKRTNYYINRRSLYRVEAKDNNGNIYFSNARMQHKLKKKYEIGDEVTVLISPDDPRNYTVLLEI